LRRLFQNLGLLSEFIVTGVLSKMPYKNAKITLSAGYVED
jgi:hypothetical protein